MAKYELLERAFIDQRLWEPGEVVEVSDDVIPGPHMKPVDASAKAAFKKTGFVNHEMSTHEIVDKIADFGASPQGIKSGMDAVGQ
ncbi:MAG: hypothetical protein ABSH41_03955 [Syntrophobacteraceae bacterium]|jgi:hypothetical protein